MNVAIMEYALHCTWKEVLRNKVISTFLILQIAIGTAAFIYSENLLVSMAKESDAREQAERDICLDIFTLIDNYEEEPPITQEDIESIQAMCGNTAFAFIVIPMFYPYKDEFAEFNLMIADYTKLNLNDEYAYIGEGITPFEDAVRQIIPTELEIRSMPESVNGAFADSEEISVAESVVIPLKYIDEHYREIAPAYVHVEWNSAEINNFQTVVRQVENYLNETHLGAYRYQIDSPNIELESYRSKVDLSINTIRAGSIMFLLICALGQISAMQILFAKRLRTYGTFLCCGSTKRQIRLQLMIEVALINLIGAAVGCIAGLIAVEELELGILPYGISNDIHSETFIAEIRIVVVTVIANFILLCRRLRRKDIVTLLRA